MHLTLQQLRLFEAVARHGSFTRAAQELFLTQPAVSIQVKRLEESVGCALFEHHGRRFHLTAVGKELYTAARDVLGRLRTLEGTVRSMQDTVAGPLQLAAVTSAKYFVPHLLGAFLNRYPDTEPRLKVTNRENALARLDEGRDDLVFMGQVPDQLPVEAFPFLPNVLVVVAHPHHPLVGAREIPLERLAEERFFMREPGSGTRKAVDQLVAEHRITIAPYMELGSGEAIKQAVMAGLGVSVISLYNLRLELVAEQIAVLDVAGFPLQRRWYAVHSKERQLSLAATTFLEFILAEAESILADLMPTQTRMPGLPNRRPKRGR